MTVPSDPCLITDPALRDVLRELIAREPIFHHPEFGTMRGDFENMTAEDFWEIGASGRRYSREFAWETLKKRHAHPAPDVWETSEFHCRQLAVDIYLLTYTLLQDKARKTRRTTIWQQTPGGWKIVFHQGTIVQDP